MRETRGLAGFFAGLRQDGEKKRSQHSDNRNNNEKLHEAESAAAHGRTPTSTGACCAGEGLSGDSLARQNRRVPSRLPVARRFPRGEKAKDHTQPGWPLR